MEPRGGIASSSRTITFIARLAGKLRGRAPGADGRVVGGDLVLQDLGAQPADRARLGQRARAARLGASSPPSRAATRSKLSALQERRDQHREEHDVEDHRRALHAGDHRERRQHDRDRAPQAGDREDHPLGPRVAEAERRHGDRKRPRDDDEDDRQHGALQRDVAQARREHQQPEREEHRHLRDPREPLVEHRHRLLGRDAGRAEAEPGDVGAAKPRAVQRVGAAEGQRRGRERRDGVQQAAGRELRPPQRPDHHGRHDHPDHRADPDLAHQQLEGVGEPVAVGRPRTSIRPITSSTAIGSLSPDSASSVRASRRRSVDPRSSAKIAAPSVDASTAPSSRPWLVVQVEQPRRGEAG